MQPSDNITVAVSAEMSAALRESVEGGEYASTGEAIRDAIRMWRRQRAEDADRLSQLRARVRRSLDDPAPSMTPEDVDALLDARFARAKRQEKTGGNAKAIG